LGRLKTLQEWLDWQTEVHHLTVDLGLDRINIVYNKLFPKGLDFKIITVAGTNGKGSTIAFIDSIYNQSKYKVATFSSPHLIKYNKRFTINSILASDEMIIAAFAKIESVRADTTLTYFEFSTLAALEIFANQKVDIAILEVGLGGRLDSVNVVDSDICAITSIDMDHMEYLGDNRELIAREKAGIMRSNKVCICGDKNPPATLLKYAKKINATVKLIDKPYAKKISIKGEHQKINAAIAQSIAQELKKDFPITDDLIATGLAKANINARFEKIKIANKEIILDVAHNPAAVKKLVQNLEQEKVKTLAIFSALADKDIDYMINLAQNIFIRWFIVPLNVDRSIQIKTLQKKFDKSLKITVLKNMEKAINNSIKLKDIQRIVIFGSFYTVADAMIILKKINN